jgi:hypothetical protein
MSAFGAVSACSVLQRDINPQPIGGNQQTIRIDQGQRVNCRRFPASITCTRWPMRPISRAWIRATLLRRPVHPQPIALDGSAARRDHVCASR